MSLVIFVACKGRKNLNSQSERSLIRSDSTFKLMQTAAGQISPYKEMKIDGKLFQVGIVDHDTVFIFTRDPSFRTIEGYGLGTPYGSLSKSLKREVVKEPGFSYWVELNSGWKLGYCIGKSCTDHNPVDTSKVNFVFRRK